MSIPAQSLWDTSTEKTSSGVSWSAVLAGAAAAAALALILIVLGAGLGMSTVSPWPGKGFGMSTVGASSIAWLVLTQIVASVAGGYLAGRLRIKWATVHTDEVYFRDTAHGFLSWAIAALATVCLVGTVAGPVASAAAGMTAATAAVSTVSDVTGQAGTGQPASLSGHNGDGNEKGQVGAEKYMIDSLFRPDPSAPDTTPKIDSAGLLEAASIFANSIHSPSLPPQDQQYLAQVVAKHTGLSSADATKRVNDTFTIARDIAANAEKNAREAADKARKTAAYMAMWMFVSLLCGAFCASLAATYGGRQRDRVTYVEAQGRTV